MLSVYDEQNTELKAKTKTTCTRRYHSLLTVSP